LRTTEYDVGLDLGTSGCRAAALSPEGQLLAAASSALPPGARDDGGRSEQAPAAWWQAACAALRELQHRLGGRALGIAVDGTSGSLLVTDAQGVPLTAGIMYDDTRAVAVLEELAAAVPHDAPVHSAGSSCAKLLWLVRQGLPRGAARALHPAEWLTARLTGRFDLGDENNCLKLGYDPTGGGWPAWLTALGLPVALLPEALPVGTPAGTLTDAAARATGLKPGTPVYAGTTDSTAAALAAGLVGDGDALTSLGSTLVLKVLSPHPVTSTPHGVYSHRLFGRWLVGGASNSGGAALRRYFSAREIAELSERVDPARPTGLDYYPLPSIGERFPVNNPRLAPRLTPRPADRRIYFQAMLEGMAHIERDGYAVLQGLGAPQPRRVLTSGGGARNRAWQRIRETALGVPVIQATHGEPAIGAALVARRGAIQQG
jgi:sugar (pentulose or hexulose) kinase